jgi:hypothetical protein
MKKLGATIFVTVISIFTIISFVESYKPSGQNEVQLIYENCTVVIEYTIWSDWQSIGGCSNSDELQQIRTRTKYDSNHCGTIEDEIINETRSLTCDYCMPKIVEMFTNWSVCSIEFEQNRTRFYIDQNYEKCCLLTGISSDCIINNQEYQQVEESKSCKPFNLSINSPINGNIYNTKKISFEIESFEETSKIDFIEWSKQRPSWIQLCKNCKFYNRTAHFNDGNYTIGVRGISALSGKKMIEESSFIVDSKNPYIYPPKIKKLGYTNGNFKVNYTENNVKEVVLYYGTNTISKTDCPSGKNQECNFYADLSDKHGQVIEFSFEVIDIADNSYRTGNYSSIVDVIPPEIVNFDYTPGINKISFTIELAEANFKDISFFDSSERKPRWRVLCPVLKDGYCSKIQSFTGGEHNLTIRFSDKAGNYVERVI